MKEITNLCFSTVELVTTYSDEHSHNVEYHQDYQDFELKNTTTIYSFKVENEDNLKKIDYITIYDIDNDKYITRDEMCKLLSDKEIDLSFRDYILEVVQYCESKHSVMLEEICKENKF